MATPAQQLLSCYSPTNASDETDIIAFYNELAVFVLRIPKHKVLIINGYMSVKGGNKFCLHNSPNRNEEYLGENSMW